MNFKNWALGIVITFGALLMGWDLLEQTFYPDYPDNYKAIRAEAVGKIFNGFKSANAVVIGQPQEIPEGSSLLEMIWQRNDGRTDPDYQYFDLYKNGQFISEIQCSFHGTVEDFLIINIADNRTQYELIVENFIFDRPEDGCIFLSMHLGGVLVGKWDLNSGEWHD